MQRRPSLANLAQALPPGARWRAVGLVRPLAVLAVLAVGTSLFSAGARLLGDRDGAAIGHVMASPSSPAERQPLAAWAGSTPPSAEIGPSVSEDFLHELKEGSFGITFTVADSAPSTELQPTVLVDAELPPLRIEIMGMGYVPHRARGFGNALVRAP